MSSRRFHQWPLVVFTTLAITGAGLLTAPLVAWVGGQARAAASASALLLLGTALLAAGLLVSLAHLGQPRRAPLALTRAGRSRLSNEIVLASVTVGAGVFASASPDLSPATRLLPSVAAVAFLVSLGLVYALPGQRAWRGAVVASPLVLGAGFGTVALAALSSWNPASPGLPRVADLAPVGAIFLAADVALVVWRRRSSAAGWATLLMALRILMVDLVPGCLLVAGLPKGAAGSLGLGILVDRLSFYLLAEQRTTESEIARVEAAIAGEDESR